MVQRATKEALEAVDRFTSNSDEAYSIRLCLSEFPIGDEYGLTTDSDREIFARFELWCEQHGIVIFYQPGSA